MQRTLHLPVQRLVQLPTTKQYLSVFLSHIVPEGCLCCCLGSRTRKFDCYEQLQDGSLFPTSEESCSSLITEPNRLLCDPRQCHSLIYLPTPWQSCDCEQNRQTRNLICVATDNPDRTLKPTICESLSLPRPATERRCACHENEPSRRLLLQEDSSCRQRNCSGTLVHCMHTHTDLFFLPGNGYCRNGHCVCHRGFEGKKCEKLMNVSVTEDPSCRDSQLRISGLPWAKRGPSVFVGCRFSYVVSRKVLRVWNLRFQL